jgi:predicted house-cleaning noncanonical NTP pyrophosphatase (MazG superfamily)
VFEKAASEEVFCPLYAKLLSELSAKYSVLLTEMTNLYSEYMEIFEEVVETSAENYNEVCKRNVEKKYRRGYSQFLAELIKHDIINNDIFMKTIIKIISKLEENIQDINAIKLNEEYADCLMKIMKAIQADIKVEESDGYSISNDSEEDDNKATMILNIRNTLKGETSARIHPLTIRNTNNVGLSNKARFTLLDIYEGIHKF